VWIALGGVGFMDARRLILGPVVVLCALVALSVVSVAPALAARGHVFEKTFAQAGSGNGELSEPQGVAVNESTGDVYVVDKGNSRVEWFSSAGVYEGQFDGSGAFEVKGTVESGTAAGFGGNSGEVETGRFSSPEEIAVDNDPSSPSFGDVYVVDVGHSVIDKFSSTGSYEGQLTGTCASAGACPGSAIPFSEIAGVAVDPHGELWVDQEQSAGEKEVANFSDAVTNEFIVTRDVGGFGFLRPGLAVDSEDNLYVHINGLFSETNVIYKFNSKGQQLNGVELENTIDTEEPTGVAVESATNDVYIDNIATVARFTSDGALLERFGAGQLQEGSGVGVNSATETVYVADAAKNTVGIYEPAPPAPPTIESESVSDVAAESATFDASINPRGPSTEYRFEYGQCASLAVSSCAGSPYEASVPAPDGQVGSGFSIAEVTAHVQDLKAHTTYHVRVVAHNGLGEESGGAARSARRSPVGDGDATP
jgi:DNA-binding beta-propeller fold protein YncE